MNEHLPSHLKLPDELSADEAGQLFEETFQTINESSSPFMATAQKVVGSAFVEWRGEGKYVYTADGTKVFDCVGAGGVFGLGFAYPDIVEAVVRQAKRGGLCTRAGFVPGQAELIRKLLSIAPDNLQYVYFGNSGTEALEAAIKLARLATGKTKLIGTHLGYHGMSLTTVGLSGINLWRDGVGPFTEGSQLVAHGCLDSLAEAMDDNTAAVVLEPIQWASGCKVPGPDYFKGVKELCQKHGVVFILDEVQTGLGRTGRKFALEHFGAEPDILCTGKILSGGMVPISAVLYSEAVHQNERMRPLFNNSSFGGNPLACSAGVTTLNLLESKYFERAEHLGELQGKAFEELRKEFPELLIGYHGLGLMRCLEFITPLHGAAFADFLHKDEGVLTASMGHIPQFVRVSPPFICDDEDMETLQSSCRRALQKLRGKTPQLLFQEFNEKMVSIQRAMVGPAPEENSPS